MYGDDYQNRCDGEYNSLSSNKHTDGPYRDKND